MSTLLQPGHTARPRTDDLPRMPEWSQRMLRPPVRLLARRRWQIHTHRADRVPTSGPAILAPNHIGWLDGPLLVALAPRVAHALTKSEMFDGGLGRLLRTVGQIAVERRAVDVAAVRAAVRALRDGQVVIVFAESARGSGEFRRVRDGCAYLALVTGAPVVPVALFGTRQAGEHVGEVPPKGRRIDIAYGEPVAVDPVPWPRTPALVRDTSSRLRTHMIDHLEEAMSLTGCTTPGVPPVPDPDESDA